MDIHVQLLEELTRSILSEAEGSVPQCHYIVGERGYGKASLLRALRRVARASCRCHIEYLNCLLTPDLDVDILTSSGRRTVWLLDDFDSFLSSSREEAQYRLREILYEADGPVIMGTGRCLPPQLSSYSAPLYDSFMLHTLRELDAGVGRMLLSDIRGNSDLPGDGILGEIFGLIGCTPENCALLASVRRYSGDAGEIIAEALKPMEPYFKGLLEALTAPQRLIITSMLSIGRPAPLKEIREATGLNSPEVMSVLVLLSKKGIVDSIRRGVRKTEYSIHDRTFSAWYRFCVNEISKWGRIIYPRA